MDIFEYTRGPRDAEILVVGEAWGSQENALKQPFMGESGRILSTLLQRSGLDQRKILFTNVVSAQPPGNDFNHFLFPNNAKETKLNGISPRPILVDGLSALYHLIDTVKPRLIIACGNWPLWALFDQAKTKTIAGYGNPIGISSWRGSQLRTSRGSTLGIPLLPIYHPAMIARDYTAFYPTLNDLKMRAPIAFTEAWDPPPPHNRHAKPNYAMTMAVLGMWRDKLDECVVYLAADIETYKRRFISVMGFADGSRSICIPFFYFQAGKMVDYFTETEEQEVVLLCREILQHPNVRLIGQNFSYDHSFLRRVWSCVTRLHADTMLMQHLCWPGVPKALDYLSSIYCKHHVYWKDESDDWDGKSDPLEYWNYNCQDTEKTFELYTVLRSLIKTLKLEDQWQHRLNMWHLSMEMSARGVAFGGAARDSAKTELMIAGATIEDYLLCCMPEDIRFTPTGKPWYSSPMWTAKIFYEFMKIQPAINRKTKRPTTDATSFDTLKRRCPLLTAPLEQLKLLRSIGVFSSNFLSVNTSFDNRIRCTFNVGGTVTFRWSSNVNPFGEGTNLQNIPEGNEDEE